LYWLVSTYSYGTRLRAPNTRSYLPDRSQRPCLKAAIFSDAESSLHRSKPGMNLDVTASCSKGPGPYLDICMYNTHMQVRWWAWRYGWDGMVDQRWPTQSESSRPADGGVDQHEVTVDRTARSRRKWRQRREPCIAYLNTVSGPIGDRHYWSITSNVLYEVLYLYIKVL